MSALAYYLPPVLALVVLSYGVALAILVSRLADLRRARRPLAYYEDFDGAGAPAAVMRPTRQLANLFEFPVLFYAAIALLVAAGEARPLFLGLAWSYAGLRAAHAVVHLTANRLWLRTPIFMAGNIVLALLWFLLARDALA